jgi:hypothetical protein
MYLDYPQFLVAQKEIKTVGSEGMAESETDAVVWSIGCSYDLIAELDNSATLACWIWCPFLSGWMSSQR